MQLHNVLCSIPDSLVGGGRERLGGGRGVGVFKDGNEWWWLQGGSHLIGLHPDNHSNIGWR